MSQRHVPSGNGPKMSRPALNVFNRVSIWSFPTTVHNDLGAVLRKTVPWFRRTSSVRASY